MAILYHNGKVPARIIYAGRDVQAVVRNGELLWPPYEYRMEFACSVQTLPASGGSSTLTGHLTTLRQGVIVSREAVQPAVRILSADAGLTLAGCTVTAPDRGTTTGARRSIELELSYAFTRFGREERFTQTMTLYQQANRIESYDVPTVRFNSVADIPAGGGTISRGVVGYAQRATYTSGATSEADTSSAEVRYSAALTAPSLGTTVKARAKVGTLTATVTVNGRSASASADVYQQANRVETTAYSAPVIGTFTVADLPASGGSVASGTVGYTQLQTDTYTSGAAKPLTLTGGGGTVSYSTPVSAPTLGTTVKVRSKVGTLTVSVTLHGRQSSRTEDVYQQANAETLTRQWTELVSDVPTLAASGGTAQLEAGAYADYGYTSGAKRERVVVGQPTLAIRTQTGTWSLDAAGRSLTAAGRGTTVGAEQSCTVRATYGTTTADVTVRQSANALTRATAVRWHIDEDAAAVAFVVPADGAPRTGQLEAHFRYTSGSEEAVLLTDYASLPASSVFSFSTAEGKVRVAAASRGTQVGNALSVSGTLTYRYKGYTYSATSTYTQAGNYVERLTPEIPSFSYADIGAGDTQARSTGAIATTMVYTSGATTRHTQGFTDSYGTLEAARRFTLAAVQNGFTAVDAATGVLTATGRGTELGNARSSAAVTLEVQFRYVPTADYAAVGTVRVQTSRSALCRQAGNYVEQVLLSNISFAYPRLGPAALEARPSRVVQTATFLFSSGAQATTAPVGGTFSLVENRFELLTVQNGFTEVHPGNGTLTASNMGTTLGQRSSGDIRRTVKGCFVHDQTYAAGGVVSTATLTATATCEQGQNCVTEAQAHADFSYPRIGPAATGATPTLAGYAVLRYASGATQRADSDTVPAGLSLSFTRSFELLEVRNGFTAVNGYGGYLVASNMGTVPGSRMSGTVRGTMSVTVQHTDALVGGTVYSPVATYDATCMQGENTVSYGEPLVRFSGVNDIPAGGGQVASGIVGVAQTATYASGATAPADVSGMRVSYSAPVVASSLGIIPTARRRVGSLTATVAVNGHSGTASTDVYQAENTVTGMTAAPRLLSGSLSVPASGGEAHVRLPVALVYSSGAVRTNQEGTYCNLLTDAHADFVQAGNGYPRTVVDTSYLRRQRLTTRLTLRGQAVQAHHLGYEIQVRFADGSDQWISHYQPSDVPERGTFERTYRFTDTVADKPIQYAHMYPVFRTTDGTSVSGTLQVRHEFAGLGTYSPDAWAPGGGTYTDLEPDSIEASGGPYWATVAPVTTALQPYLRIRIPARGPEPGDARTGEVLASAIRGSLKAPVSILITQGARY